MEHNKHTIMVIDDHPIIHDGLKTLLASETDLEITSSATSSADAIGQLEGKLPDLAIVDLSLSDSDGTYLIQRLNSKFPRLRMLIYSMSEEKLFAERAAKAGAAGYVMKTSSSSILKKAIYSILEGGTFFSEDILERIEKKEQKNPTLFDMLSNREMDVFKLIGQGLDAASISDKLNISRNTVDTHRINIKNKLELSSGKALDRLAYEVIQQGVLPK
jgi:DNA-binding NarL/FixJ family response regulator